MQDLFTNTFPLDGKINLSVAMCLKMEEKNSLHQPENQFPLAGISLFFKNWISPSSRKKSPNKRVLFQVHRKSVSTRKNGEFV